VLAAILTGMEHGLDRGVEPIAPLNDNRQSGIDFPKDALGAWPPCVTTRWSTKAWAVSS
jgi:hypothetical protein